MEGRRGIRGVFVVPTVVVAVLLAGCASADNGTPAAAAPGSGSPAAAAAKTLFAVGQPMKNGANQTVTVTSFKRGVSTGNEFMLPAAGNECVQVDLSLVNGDSNPWMAPLFEMSVVDVNGQSHNESFTCGSGSNIDSLIKGGKATATLFFEVPNGSALNFTWTPNIFNANSTYQTALK